MKPQIVQEIREQATQTDEIGRVEIAYYPFD